MKTTLILVAGLVGLVGCRATAALKTARFDAEEIKS